MFENTISIKMAEIFNRPSKQKTLSSLKHRIHRFCNYIILNFSRNCKYLDEIGIDVQNELIALTVKTDFVNKEIFENEWQKFLDHKFFKDEKQFLDEIGTLFQENIVDRSFTDTFIKKLSHYYFIPESTKNRFIFKYSSVNKNLISLLTNNTLWFADPNTFNDPFDCRSMIDADPREDEIRQFYYNLSNRNVSFLDFSRSFEMPSRMQFLKDLERHHYTNSIRKLGICCFSESYNNKLMWAHYAENVTGVCLVFDTSIEVAEGHYSFSGDKVKYRDGPIKKFYDASGIFEVTDILYTKSKEWQYEREIRERLSFEKGDTNRAISFDPNSLVGIIFGAKMSTNDKQTIKNLIVQFTKYNLELIDSHIDLANNDIKLSKNRFGLK